ncbi:type II toxin-antitoxin system VapC family toxin [Shinella yambaruensis]|uniref:Twitching motility protein PilT n=1 Tax=Shinella yambaruensis TaxID=415996 RepID=A0ABQ5ZFM4_9HYPH|nr:type II toxin-antitoxin system VapC family toxin [Shinella yambaruensis]MCJ8024385.1 type II toxin-antitoxin system VapC family toxin [Shinella yambaruensis]MCU7980827.1 type II toxin-antitoxin system VapC family toxin [Shinella yambaruensis]GLR49683.1 twitching motility protein PilT [Shinella yambaruensis]
MKLLIDTHLLLWAASSPERLSEAATALMADPENTLYFSVASLWEVVIKSSLDREDFQADAARLRRGLVDNGYVELPIIAGHAIAVADLPHLHRDPFDRILIAQAKHEGLLLLTADARVADYGGPVRLV